MVRLASRILLVLCAAVAVAGPANATPPPSSSWVTTFGGSGTDITRAVATLADGSTVVTGQFQGTINFGNGISLQSAGDYDLFVARINRDGTFGWAFRGGGTGLDVAQGIVQRPDGLLLVTAYYTGNATFSTASLTNQASNTQEILFAALDPVDGSVRWTTTGGGTGNDYVYRLRALPDNSFVAVGSAQRTGVFGSTTLPPSIGEGDLFATRVNADGSYRWTKRLGGSTDFDDLFNITTFPDGSFAAVGYIRRLATFGSDTLQPNPGNTTNGRFANVLVLKINADGDVVWARQAGSPTGDDFGNGISAMPDGSMIVGGFFSGTAAFGTHTVTSRGAQDAFLARYNADGTVAWVRTGGSVAGDDWIRELVARADGSILAAIQFRGAFRWGSLDLTSQGDADVLFAQFDQDGNMTSHTVRGGPGTDSARFVDARPDGLFTAAGTFSGTVQFGAQSRTSAGSEDGFVEGFMLVPDAPPPPTIVTGAGWATATIAPAAGGSVTRYDITARPGGSTCAIVPPAVSCTISGLEVGTAYAFTTVATNSAGQSTASGAAEATIPADATPAPTQAGNGAAASSTAGASASARWRLGPLRGRLWRVGLSVVTTGSVPEGATAVVQGARRTSAARGMGATALSMRPCRLEGSGTDRRYRCVQWLRPGTWRLVTEARSADGQTSRMDSRVRLHGGVGPAVTG